MSKKKDIDYNKVAAKDNMVINNEGDTVPERKSLEKVVSANPVKVKRNLASRLISGLLGPDGLSGVGAYLSEDIIIPAIKNTIMDAVTSGVTQIMYGDSGGPARHRGGGNHNHGSHGYSPRPKVNYTSQYTSRQPEPTDRREHRTVRQGVQEYTITERSDAAHVLTTLTEQADMYGTVSLADYYDLIGIPSEYTDNNYGWRLEEIVHTSIRPVRGGHVIKFPPADVI